MFCLFTEKNMFNGRKIITLTCLLLALSACKKNDGKETPSPQAALPEVHVVELAPQDVPLSFEFAARAQGSKETEVRARVGGILLKRNYVEGTRVEEGSVLFQIDPAPYQVALNQAKAQLAQAQAQLRNAETQWKRTEKLFKQGYASEKTRDEARSNKDSMEASVQLAQAEVDSAQLNLDYTTVKAPISGITSMETQSEGSLISVSGDAGLLTHITQLDPIYVIFSASENDILSLGNMVERGLLKNPENKSEVVARLRFGNGTEYSETGTINFINPTIDESTGTIKLRAVFPNPRGKVRPGQFLRLVIDGVKRINALAVPQEAVMQGANGAFVYRVNAGGIVEMVHVQTGLTTPDGLWILDEGVDTGDRIIISDLLKLRPGMQVKPISDAAAKVPVEQAPAN